VESASFDFNELPRRLAARHPPDAQLRCPVLEKDGDGRVFTVTVKRLAMERLIVVSTRPLSGALGDR
jgi:hypothetical protein